MAILQVSSAPSRAAYDAVQRVINLAADPPAGLQVHSAAEAADGTVVIVDLWVSHATMDAFEQGRLLPAIAGSGFPMGEPPTRLEAFEDIRG
jgi:hypothetical protein